MIQLLKLETTLYLLRERNKTNRYVTDGKRAQQGSSY